MGAGPSNPLKPCLPIKHRLTFTSRWQGSKAEIGTSATSGAFISSQTFLAWPVSLLLPNPHPARELTQGSEKVYWDKLIMEIALCHPLLLAPCSIIFYLFRVFASSPNAPQDEAVGPKAPTGVVKRWGGGGHLVLVSLTREHKTLLIILKNAMSTLVKGCCISQCGENILFEAEL